MESSSMISFEKSFPKASKKPLPRSFYQRPTLKVARDLLGKGLWVKKKDTLFLCRLVEVEAYLAEEDPASHSFKGPTPRNAPMFLEGGAVYVYLTYGMHFCMNVSTETSGRGAAVLFRAAEPLIGLKEMQKNRKLKAESPVKNLLSGPAKLTQALGIGLKDNRKKFFLPELKLIDLGEDLSDSQIVSTPRIGISKGTELPFRFIIKDSPWISKHVFRKHTR